MRSLVIAEHEYGVLKADTAKVVNAANQVGAEIDVLLVGHNVTDAAATIATIAGVNNVLVADNAVFEHQLAENVADLVCGLANDYSHIFAPATTSGKNVLPRIAALLDKSQISEITAVVDAETFKRPIYAGNGIATVKSLESQKVITVRSSAFDLPAQQAPCAITALSQGDASNSSSFVSVSQTESVRPELTAAEVIISGGRGMQNGENFSLLEGIADKLGAAIGASRAAVDAGFVPNDMQVGQTGKIVAPNLYIAVGISGAIQHLAGMKDSKVIVAINKDPDAPIFQVADYGLVADLFDVLPALEKAL
ncbi:electron transfer flavoprotein subunit alpha/FixB family protein [Pseudoalteromonas tunicata]|jgi:electron transfer flavoprotein alpha subunit|uniref:Electron transfer flavoprotein subunit alpha n=1 Tax=Pseudoalteromonas tunicata D2 TaxID=87626 RepID=A4C9H0_9GAMM|nr:FAD-binding protein [Pseudoalteromonas tunicata]ATC94575.1 electron transfer flavoprotein alpha subunit [Pseudoalteromonas tunicata]AXT30302.1 electron transfer flavoprotein subunit alpha [Pseudoalteromonas tunicata]EAR28028.1 electron transfer flavoprotein alpha-subunit [Pseudoalteromonas tunicata D2]